MPFIKPSKQDIAIKEFMRKLSTGEEPVPPSAHPVAQDEYVFWPAFLIWNHLVIQIDYNADTNIISVASG